VNREIAVFLVKIAHYKLYRLKFTMLYWKLSLIMSCEFDPKMSPTPHYAKLPVLPTTFIPIVTIVLNLSP
jgi:hypothetical protein